jgi:hypothetical protein
VAATSQPITVKAIRPIASTVTNSHCQLRNHFAPAAATVAAPIVIRT